MRAALCTLLCGSFLAGCGEERFVAGFTSQIVQHDTCRVVGDRPEVCQTDETLTTVTVRLVEREDDNFWLIGLPRDGGEADRALLGSEDDEGGWLFVEEIVRENEDSGCNTKDRLEISLAVDPKADPDAIGTDDCVALVGREIATTGSTDNCDTVNDPPLASTVIERRRWEKAPSCKK